MAAKLARATVLEPQQHCGFFPWLQPSPQVRAAALEPQQHCGKRPKQEVTKVKIIVSLGEREKGKSSLMTQRKNRQESNPKCIQIKEKAITDFFELQIRPVARGWIFE